MQTGSTSFMILIALRKAPILMQSTLKEACGARQARAVGGRAAWCASGRVIERPIARAVRFSYEPIKQWGGAAAAGSGSFTLGEFMNTQPQYYNLLIASVLLALTSCQRPNPNPTVDRKVVAGRIADASSQLPSGWRLEDISRAVPAPDGPANQPVDGKVAVLAWKICQDARPFTTEQALVLKEFSRPGTEPLWVIASVYQPVAGIWEISEIRYMMPSRGDSPGYCRWVRHCKTLGTRPRNKEIYDFMDEFKWILGSEEGWRLLGGQVCSETWRNVVGEAPTRTFPQ